MYRLVPHARAVDVEIDHLESLLSALHFERPANGSFVRSQGFLLIRFGEPRGSQGVKRRSESNKLLNILSSKVWFVASVEFCRLVRFR